MRDPVRKMRALLDLAAEVEFDDARRAEWLREAGALGVYRRALRDELYDSMTEVGDFDGLEGAIAMELTQASLQRSEAAKLGLRRGRALDVLSRRSDAIEVLGDAGAIEPANADIALERSRIEQLTDRLDDARRTLEACLAAGVDGVGRLEVLNRVADLHLMQGGRVERAIEALEEAYARSEGAADWALRLASAHARYGDATRAAELLEAQLAEPPRAEELVHWHLLATIYSSRLSAPEDAAEILWRLFRTFPERRSTVQWLEDFYKDGKGAAALADGIGNLLTNGDLGVTDAVAARLWEYVGELNLSVLERMSQAEAAFRRARQLGERSSANALRLARSVARQPGRVSEAVPLVMDALAEGTEARVWEDAFAQLESLFDQMQLHARLRVARQVRLVLGANVEPLDAGMRRDPGREIAPEVAWSHLVSDLLFPDEIEVLRGSSLLAEKVFHRMDPTVGQVATRRMNRAEFPAFTNYLETACRWLGVQVPGVWLAEPLRGARVLGVGKAWVNATRVADAEPLRARFWAGWIAGLVFSELAPYTWVDEPSVEDFFAAVAGAAGHGAGGTPAMAEEVGALMRMGPRRAAVSALDANPEFLSRRGRARAHHARCVADRAGYLMCGDLRTAVEEILGAIGWDLRIENARTRETILRDDRMRSLLLFAISDAHFLIRYESGLAERPRVFV
jgi:tetratricopeptide (TPR) repeat protein